MDCNKATALKTINGAEMSMMNYFSLGCGRSTEVKDAPPFTTAKLFFNRIVHQMRSNKGEAHGQTRNEFLPHYMSPSLSRRYILSVVVKSGQLLREGAIDQVNCFRLLVNCTLVPSRTNFAHRQYRQTSPRAAHFTAHTPHVHFAAAAPGPPPR